jgi:hypothetical protein
MKKLILFVLIAICGAIACKIPNPRLDCCDPLPSVETPCITTKLNAMRTANANFTSVKRFTKNAQNFWLFDNGAAFDAPQYMLNAACDTVCVWAFRAAALPCQKDFNLGDTTAVVIWKK